MPINYVGRIIEIFYLSQAGELSIRQISIKSMRDGIVKAVCIDSGEWRTFRVDHILSWEFVKKGEVYMLSDIERKMLRILRNYDNVHRCFPSFETLEYLTGRNKLGNLKAIIGLEEQGYITGTRGYMETIVVIEGWERTDKFIGTNKKYYYGSN